MNRAQLLRVKFARPERPIASYYCFENGDGTRYSVHILEHYDGGMIVHVNNDSSWLWFEGETTADHEVKFQFGKNNKYTKRAVHQIMNMHWERFGGLDE